MALYLDWPAENAHRSYPFAPVDENGNASINSVPSALLLDVKIIATDNLPDNASTAGGSTYISQVVTDGSHIRFYMAMSDGEGTIDFGCVATVSVDSPVGLKTPISYFGNDIVFEGFIITGDTSVTALMPPVINLDKDSGRLNTVCIHHMTGWIAGLKVDGKTYGGLVTLSAGAGVTLSANGNTLTISCSGAIPPDNQSIVNDDQLLQRITDLYGTPISKINGFDAGGDWTIECKETEGLQVNVNPDTHSITITNLNASACCSQDDIKVLVDNISSLNDRVGILQSFQNQLDIGINTLSAQLTRVL